MTVCVDLVKFDYPRVFNDIRSETNLNYFQMDHISLQVTEGIKVYCTGSTGQSLHSVDIKVTPLVKRELKVLRFLCNKNSLVIRIPIQCFM